MNRTKPSRVLIAWPAGLVLLFIAGLAVVGLVLLRQDRRLAEQEAEAFAQDLARAFANDCRESLSKSLSAFIAAAQQDQQSLAAQARGTVLLAPSTNHVESLLRKSDGLAASIPRVQCVIRGKELTAPRNFEAVPEPPDWLLTTPHDWIVKLERAELSRAGSTEQAALLKDLLGANIRPLQANAEYEQALLTQDSSAREAQLIQIASRSDGVTTEAGLPLRELALLRALQAHDTRASAADLLSLARSLALDQPSFLTERMLDELDQHVLNDGGAVQLRMKALRSLWRRDVQARALLKTWLRQGAREGAWKLPGEAGGYFLFSSMVPMVATNLAGETEAGSTPNSNQLPEYAVTLIPYSVVDAALRVAASEIAPRWPPYFDLSLVLVDHRFWVNPLDVSDQAEKPQAWPLASQPETLTGALPGSYPLQVTIGLADPPLLFRAQQQRMWLFGTMIVVSAALAAAGAAFLQRNFNTQLRLNEAKSNFVSSVSHELRAPIASVRLMAESLEQGKIQDDQKQNEYYRFIVQECRRLSALIENVLDFSRIEQGRKEYHFEPTDLASLVKQTVKTMVPYAAEREVALDLRGLESAPATNKLEPCVDGRAIQQALVNLIDNAIKHSPRKGTVAVGVDASCGQGSSSVPISSSAPATSENAPASSILLWVEDYGDGIPAEEHEKIFERFYRRGSELRRETQGVGIGLSIVKHIVVAHGGRVLVRSAVGQGSRFTIELPASWNASS